MAEPVWDDRLISRERALQLAGRWPVHFDVTRIHVYVRCLRCGQSCGRFVTTPGAPNDSRPTDVEEILAAVLRHAVTAHDLALSGTG